MTSLEVKDRSWADESSWEDVSFKQVDQYFEPRTMPLASVQDNRKRKYEPVVSVNAEHPFSLGPGWHCRTALAYVLQLQYRSVST